MSEKMLKFVNVDQETPKITVNLKVLDELGDQGTYALLDDALEYKGVNFKQFLKVHCVLLIEQEVADSFVTSFEDENYTTTTDYFCGLKIQNSKAKKRKKIL